MIVIIDNGVEYSGHRIYFVDIGSLPVEPAVELLLERTRCGYNDGDDAFVVAVVGICDWRAPTGLTCVSRLWEDVSEHGCMVERCRDTEIESVIGSKQNPRWVRLTPEQHAKLDAINARPWTPEECKCTCESGKLYELAHS